MSAAPADFQRILVVGDRQALIGAQEGSVCSSLLMGLTACRG